MFENGGRIIKFALRFQRAGQIVHGPEFPRRAGRGEFGSAQPTLGNGEFAVVKRHEADPVAQRLVWMWCRPAFVFGA